MLAGAQSLTAAPQHIDTNAHLQGLTGIATSTTVVRDGFYIAGDGGAATYTLSATNCAAPDNATQVQPAFPTVGCWILQAPIPTDVRVWGAHCDVTAFQGSANWDPNKGTAGALVVNGPVPPYVTGGIQPIYIAMSQLGGPTLWKTTTDAVWATRWSTLPAAGANYSPSDLISFYGDSSAGVYSQQVAITVDTVKSVTVGSVTTNGVIDKWHFLWGGLYKASSPPVGSATGGALAQDDAHSYCANGCGAMGTAAGALLLPTWSGWSVLDKQNILSGGTTYVVGDKISLKLLVSGSTVLREPTLIVEKVSATTGAIQGFDWLDYGSLSQLAADPTTLIQDTTTSAHGTGFQLNPVAWTRGPFVTTVTSIVPQGGSSMKTNVYLADTPPFYTELPVPGFTGTTPVQYVYLGHDDGAAINNALKAGNPSAVHLPGRCGTTTEVDLPQDAAATSVNPALVGDNFLSTGLYAFGSNAATRSGAPLTSRVLYKGLANAYGGGFRNMTIEGLGIPEGYGYYGLYQGPVGSRFTIPSTSVYVGPPYTSPGQVIPTWGDAVELDAGKYLRVTDVYIEDGGIGSGNSIYQCGLDEAFPEVAFPSPAGGVGNSVISDSRFDSNSTISGATNPDFSLRLGNSCHDTVYQSLTAYDGTKADVLEYNGNLFSKIHINSDAANSNTGLVSTKLVWDSVSPLAGVADYGFYALGNTSLSQTQCDIANLACVHLAGNLANASHNPGQVTDTQMKCGALTSVPPNYYAVQLSTGAVNTTISGTAASNQCSVPGSQLINLEGSIDSTVSICNNSNATVVLCGPAYVGFTLGQLYTQPATTFDTITTPTTSNPPPVGRLYATPFISPSGGTITKVSIYVNTTGTASGCRMGIYASSAGVPNVLLVDAGSAPVTTTGMQTITLTQGVLLLPNTLYFLAVGCDNPVTLQATSATGNLAGVLAGYTLPTSTAPLVNTAVYKSGYVSGPLPSPFGNVKYGPAGSNYDAPNVYVQP